MNWFRRAMTKTAQTSAGGILMDALRNNEDGSEAIKRLTELNDPSTCSTIAALIDEAEVQSAFPNAVSLLYRIGNELHCMGGVNNNTMNDDTMNNQMNNTDIPMDENQTGNVM